MQVRIVESFHTFTGFSLVLFSFWLFQHSHKQNRHGHVFHSEGFYFVSDSVLFMVGIRFSQK